MIARRDLLVVCLVLLLGPAAIAQVPNVSDGRSIGVGIQVGLPYGGLLSTRAWFSPTVGAEAIVFVLGESGDVDGTVTVRGLFRVSDTEVVDFYVATGGTLSLEDDPFELAVHGGIEFGFRAAAALSWNIEFGASYALDGTLNMAIGTGLHYYFPSD